MQGDAMSSHYDNGTSYVYIPAQYGERAVLGKPAPQVAVDVAFRYSGVRHKAGHGVAATSSTCWSHERQLDSHQI